jgi:hypothetical protein
MIAVENLGPILAQIEINREWSRLLLGRSLEDPVKPQRTMTTHREGGWKWMKRQREV